MTIASNLRSAQTGGDQSRVLRRVRRLLIRVACVCSALAASALAVPQMVDARQFCYSDRYKGYAPFEVCNQGNPHAITYVQMTGYRSTDFVCAAKATGGATNSALDGTWACAAGQGRHYYNGEYPRYAVNQHRAGSYVGVGDFFYNY
jgi:hypothetical protein